MGWAYVGFRRFGERACRAPRRGERRLSGHQVVRRALVRLWLLAQFPAPLGRAAILTVRVPGEIFFVGVDPGCIRARLRCSP
ncbi:hypothetical protein AV521_14875 [Streptomyces sp. IMTB 2501]|nr:hypothetical protein AV521_14875 [Streptomyces sp. IMTB 2501]